MVLYPTSMILMGLLTLFPVVFPTHSYWWGYPGGFWWKPSINRRWPIWDFHGFDTIGDRCEARIWRRTPVAEGREMISGLHDDLPRLFFWSLHGSRWNIKKAGTEEVWNRIFEVFPTLRSFFGHSKKSGIWWNIHQAWWNIWLCIPGTVSGQLSMIANAHMKYLS